MYCVLGNYIDYSYMFHFSRRLRSDFIYRGARDIWYSNDGLYILYDLFEIPIRTKFFMGKCILGNGDWNVFGGRTKYLEIMPVTLLFTEVL